MEPSIPELCYTQLLWHHCLTPPISRLAQLKSGAEIKYRTMSHVSRLVHILRLSELFSSNIWAAWSTILPANMENRLRSFSDNLQQTRDKVWWENGRRNLQLQLYSFTVISQYWLHKAGTLSITQTMLKILGAREKAFNYKDFTHMISVDQKLKPVLNCYQDLK